MPTAFTKYTIVILLILCAHSALYSQIHLQQGLQLYLPCNGNTNDASGNGNNAINYGATLTTDEYGNANSAYYFDGSSDYMEISNSASIALQDSFSLVAKVYPMGFYNGTCQANIIFQKGDNDAIPGWYSLRFSDNGFDADCNISTPNKNNFYGYMQGGNALVPFGTAAGQIGSPPYINANNWYCVAATWNSDSIKIYVNGILYSKWQNNFTPGINSDNLVIGHLKNTLFPYWFNGKLDDLRIYNRAISAQEVTALCTTCNSILSLNNIITTADTSVCTGDSLLLNTVSALPSYYTYTWSPSATLNLINNTNPKAYPTGNTTYQVIVADSNGCTNQDVINVQVHVLPNVFAGPNVGNCSGASITLNAFGNGTFQWLPTTGLNNSTVANPICTNTTITTYTVTITDTNGCRASDDVQVAIGHLPGLNIPAQYYYCLGDAAIQLTAAGVGNFTWAPAAGLSASNINFPYANPSFTTIYTVTANNGPNCSQSSVVTVNVNPKPNLAISSNDTVCKNGSTQLNAFGAQNYFWNPSGTLNNSNIANPMASPFAPTVYTVTASNSANCSVTSTVFIDIAPTINLQIDATPDSTFCLGDSIQLIAYGGISYTWAPTFNTNVISNNSVKIWPINSTTYTVVATDEIGCTSVNTYHVVVQNPPIVNITKSNNINCMQKTATLTASGADTYSWGPVQTLNTNFGNTVIASPLQNTIYKVECTLGKCVVTDSILLEYISDQNRYIYIPNAITMNDDGLNDGFRIQSKLHFNSFQLIIMNRWGEVVFQSEDINKVWYGEYKGRYAKLMDAYFYILKVKDDCGEIMERGDITVIR